ncbi:hypothetical protein ACHAW5_007681 [Stephanodiscus triporus]|uniref:Histone RNA hairpin-binding protein RNA-binding domain-containing protein n=1 Tax=Stephanodiscus triporus TaxID=2934178 RepID=A0ABD3NFY6_9STRA
MHHDDDYHDNRQHGPSPSPSPLSSSRWVPPPPPPPPPADGVICGNDQNHKQHDFNSGEGKGGGGRRGGGKIIRERRHSNDAHNQRNQHRARRPQERRNFVTPDVKESLASSHHHQQQSTHSTTTATFATTTATNVDIPKLNPDDPVHAKRIHQRRRQVLFGKNTVGYEEYTKKIPRHKRKHRSLDCPMTPDHMLDIPAKRWQGLMNAWRRALHKYDPLDLHLRQPSQTTITLAPRPCVTEEDVQQEEIAQAKAMGLQVAFGSMNVGKEAAMFSINVAADEGMVNDDARDTVGREGEDWAATTIRTAPKTEKTSFFDEEAAYKQTLEGDIGLEECDSDSDNDLL